jgi:UDP-glucose 4-epimerase
VAALGEAAAPFRGSRVLVTGGLGFIGSNLARPLVTAGARVTLVDSLAPQYGGNRANIAGLEDDVHVEIADVRDEPRTRALVRDQDVVFNLAGQTSHLDSMVDPYTDLEMNCRAQLAVLEACRRAPVPPKVVFAGTRQIYGRPRYVPVDEAHPIDPVDVNGIHKTAAEWYHALYGDVYGLRTCTLRLTNTYGPRMRVKDARQTFLGVWLRAVIRGERFEIWGDGTQRRDFTYVDDAVHALLLAGSRAEADGEVFNLGGPPFTLREVAELLVEVAGSGSYRVVPFPSGRAAIDIGDYFGDHVKIRDRLGWQPRVSLREGLARSVAFYREHCASYWDEAA